MVEQRITISQPPVPSPTTSRLRVFLSDKQVSHSVTATLLRLNAWVDALQADRSDLALPSTGASDAIEQIAEGLVDSVTGIDRQLLIKSLQEALYYCVSFAINLSAPQITDSVKRFLDSHGKAAFLQRFLSLYFFNAVWFHTADLFRGQAVTVEVLENDLKKVDRVCQKAIASAYKHVDELNGMAAETLLRDIEQRLRNSGEFEK